MTRKIGTVKFGDEARGFGFVCADDVTMGELGMTVLPAVNGGLKDLKALLEGIRGVLPGTSKPGAGTKIATRAGEGAIAGGVWGMFGGPYGVLGGAAVGGVIGGVEGIAEQYMGGTPASGKPGARYQEKHAGDPSLLGAVMGLLKSQADEKHETAGERYERRMAEHGGNAELRKPSWRRWR